MLVSWPSARPGLDVMRSALRARLSCWRIAPADRFVISPRVPETFRTRPARDRCTPRSGGQGTHPIRRRGRSVPVDAARESRSPGVAGDSARSLRRWSAAALKSICRSKVDDNPPASSCGVASGLGTTNNAVGRPRARSSGKTSPKYSTSPTPRGFGDRVPCARGQQRRAAGHRCTAASAAAGRAADSAGGPRRDRPARRACGRRALPDGRRGRRTERRTPQRRGAPKRRPRRRGSIGSRV